MKNMIDGQTPGPSIDPDPMDITTPRTDAEEETCSADPTSAYMQMRDFARRLEQEIAGGPRAETSDNNIRLLPCPCCGGDAELEQCDRVADDWLVRCMDCDLNSIPAKKAETAAQWNRRIAQTWECGCGHINGVNLSVCAVCARRPYERT
jgi:hypothetical protein